MLKMLLLSMSLQLNSLSGFGNSTAGDKVVKEIEGKDWTPPRKKKKRNIDQYGKRFF